MTGDSVTFEAGILSIIVALIRRGSIMRLADLRINRVWLVFVPAVLLVASMFGRAVFPREVWVPVTGWLHVVANLAFLALFWSNLRLPGMKWFFAGWAINILPILANAGKMPVSAWAARMANTPDVQTTMRHALMSSQTRFNFLGDFIPATRPPMICPAVLSPGDILMAIGIFILIQITMCPRKPACAAGSEG